MGLMNIGLKKYVPRRTVLYYAVEQELIFICTKS